MAIFVTEDEEVRAMLNILTEQNAFCEMSGRWCDFQISSYDERMCQSGFCGVWMKKNRHFT